MKPLAAALLWTQAVIVAACMAGPAELIVRGQGPDGCRYEGPTQVSERRPVEFGASPSGGGRISAAIRELRTDDGELDKADLGRIVARVENENEINLATTSAELVEGEYAITCHYEGFDDIVGTITVTP